MEAAFFEPERRVLRRMCVEHRPYKQGHSEIYRDQSHSFRGSIRGQSRLQEGKQPVAADDLHAGHDDAVQRGFTHIALQKG